MEHDLGCSGIDVKTLFSLRHKLIHAMAEVTPPKLSGVIQIDETFIRESQKGHNLELVSYIKGEIREPRYGYKPSKLGTMGPEFVTVLIAVDSRGYCVCELAALGRAPVNRKDAEDILKQLVPLKITRTGPELSQVEMTTPKASGRSVQLLKEKTAAARRKSSSVL